MKFPLCHVATDHFGETVLYLPKDSGPGIDSNLKGSKRTVSREEGVNRRALWLPNDPPPQINAYYTTEHVMNHSLQSKFGWGLPPPTITRMSGYLYLVSL